MEDLEQGSRQEDFNIALDGLVPVQPAVRPDEKISFMQFLRTKAGSMMDFMLQSLHTKNEPQWRFAY